MPKEESRKELRKGLESLLWDRQGKGTLLVSREVVARMEARQWDAFVAATLGRQELKVVLYGSEPVGLSELLRTRMNVLSEERNFLQTAASEHESLRHVPKHQRAVYVTQDGMPPEVLRGRSRAELAHVKAVRLDQNADNLGLALVYLWDGGARLEIRGYELADPSGFHTQLWRRFMADQVIAYAA